MTDKLTGDQLRGLAAELREGLGTSAFVAPSPINTLQFGSVRLGALQQLWECKLHPLVIVLQWVDHVPPTLLLCPSTSIPHNGPSVLCLPAGAILLRKRGRSVVPSYILCKLKLRVATSVVESMEFLNNLEDKYLNLLKQCLQEAQQ